MTATIPNLWPDDIKVDVLPPLAILRVQASKIHQLTKGVLLGDIQTLTGSDGFVSHRLDLIAPTLDNRRKSVVSVTHREAFYPVVIEADCYRPKIQQQPIGYAGAAMSLVIGAPEWPDAKDWRPIADSQEEFLRRVGEVLKSKEVRAVIDSLLALSNEKNQPAEEPAA
jgi:hypothetical protein